MHTDFICIFTLHSHTCWLRWCNHFSKDSLFHYEPTNGKELLQSQIKPNCQCSLDTNNPRRDSWASEVAWQICLKGPLKRKWGKLGPSHSFLAIYLKNIKQRPLTSLLFTLCVIVKVLKNTPALILCRDVLKYSGMFFPNFLPENPHLDPFLHLYPHPNQLLCLHDNILQRWV